MSQEILGTALFRRGAGGGVVRFGLRIWSGGVLGRSILTLLHYWSNSVEVRWPEAQLIRGGEVL